MTDYNENIVLPLIRNCLDIDSVKYSHGNKLQNNNDYGEALHIIQDKVEQRLDEIESLRMGLKLLDRRMRGYSGQE